MAISRPLNLLLCAAAAIGAFALEGCARAVARPPGPAPTPAASTHPQGPAEPALQSPQNLDPDEEITPSELASIPDPVPPAGAARLPASAADPQAGALGSPGDPAQGVTPGSGRSPARGRQNAAPSDFEATIQDTGIAKAAFTWRVQIFAAQDLGLADRKAKEAGERLRVKARLVYEAPYYKVRLGDYASEEEAHALRERAIQAGYTGAFRVRCEPDTTQYGY